MLSTGEKAYCSALLALKSKDYRAALEHFTKAAPYFRSNAEFNLCFETTRLLVAVRRELNRLENEDRLEVEEVYSNG